MTIGRRIVIAMSVIGLIAILAGGLLIQGTNSIYNNSESLEIRSKVQLLLTETQGLFEVRNANRLLVQADPANTVEYASGNLAINDRILAIGDELFAMDILPEVRSGYEDLLSLINIPAHQVMFEGLVAAGKPTPEYLDWMESGNAETMVVQVQDLLGNAVDTSKANTVALQEKSVSEFSRVRMIGIIAVLAVGGAALVIGRWLVGSVSGVVGSSAVALGEEAVGLAVVSSQLGANAEEAAVQAGVVSAAAEEVSVNVSTVASAVEEQTATTNEISRSVAEAASGSLEIADNITHVADAARSTSEGAQAILSAQADLERVTADLQALVGKTSATGQQSGLVNRASLSIPVPNRAPKPVAAPSLSSAPLATVGFDPVDHSG